MHIVYCICHVRPYSSCASHCNFENWESSKWELNGPCYTVVVVCVCVPKGWSDEKLVLELIGDSSTSSYFFASVLISFFLSLFFFIYLCVPCALFILSNVYSIRQKHHFQFCQNIFFFFLKYARFNSYVFFSVLDSSIFACFHHLGSQNEISLYSSNEISGNESNEAKTMTESERQADFNRQKEEMKIKRRKKKRTSSSMQSSTFKGKRNNSTRSHWLYHGHGVNRIERRKKKRAQTCELRNRF